MRKNEPKFYSITGLIGLVGYTGSGRHLIASRPQGRIGSMSSWSTVELRAAARRDLVRLMDGTSPSGRPFWTLDMKRGVKQDTWIDGGVNEEHFAKLTDAYYRMMKASDPDIWWRRSSIMYKRQVRGRGIIIPDVSDVNEAEKIQDIGGVIIRVYREKASPLTEAEGRDVGDLDMAGIYYTDIHNDCGVRELTDRIREIITGIWPENPDLGRVGVKSGRDVFGYPV